MATDPPRFETPNPAFLNWLADGVGFEPTDGRPSLVFKTSALNHSATHPEGGF